MNEKINNQKNEEKDVILKRTTAYYKGFGFDYSKIFTTEKETIWYTAFILFNKHFIFSISDGDWVDEDGKTKTFKVEDKTLYIKKLAFGIG